MAKECYELRGVETKITLSMGVANIPKDTLELNELIKIADMRLYEAKRKGKNVVVA